MGKLNRRVRTAVRQGKMVPATILDHGGGKASVQLSTNGATMRMLPMVGGPVAVGQQVYVDYNTYPPQVVAPGAEPEPVGNPRSRTRTPPRGTPPELSGDLIRRYAGGTRLVEIYEVTEAGLAEAVSDAVALDLILMPPCELTPTDFTLPADVTLAGDLRDSVILHCQITLSNNSKLYRFQNVHSSGSDAGEISAVICNGTEVTIDDMTIWACQCTSGSANGVKISGGTLTVTNSNISGETISGTGYGVNAVSGNATVRQTTVYGSTSQYSGAVYVYNTVLGTEVCDCAGAGDVVCAGVLWSPLIYPYNNTGNTIKDVGSTMTVVDSLDLASADNVLNYPMTTDYLFVNLGASLYRIALDGSGSDSTSTPPSHRIDGMTVKDNNTVFVHYFDDDDHVVLAKYDFVSDTWTTLYTDSAYESYDCNYAGRTFAWDDCYFLTYYRYGTVESLVSCLRYQEDSQNGDMVRIMVYSLVSNVLVSFDWFDVMPEDEHAQIGYGYWAIPRGYQDKLIWTIGIDTYEALQQACPCPSFCVNISTGVVTKIDDLSRNPALNEYGGCVQGNSGMDFSTGYYYFGTSLWDNDNHNAIIKIDMSTLNTTVLNSGLDNLVWLTQSENGAYLLQETSPDVWHLQTLPDLTDLGYFPSGTSYVMVDIQAGYGWGLAVDDDLYGIDLDGSSDVTKTLTWPNPQYKYASNRSTSFMLVANNVLAAKIYSNDAQYGPYVPPTHWQNEVVILGGS